MIKRFALSIKRQMLNNRVYFSDQARQKGRPIVYAFHNGHKKTLPEPEEL
jgi:hypothetical protein